MTSTHPAPAALVAPSLNLTGKKVVVVGGKTGIGLGIAQAALAAGATVIVGSRRLTSTQSRPDLADLQQAVLDMRDESSVRSAFADIGPFDHLVVTAAPDVGSWGSFMDADMGGVRSYVEGKLLGTWACARHAAPLLRAGGSMSFLSGGMAVRPKPGFAAVTASFAAVEALAASLAVELAPTRVNTIRPGYVETDMWNFLPAEVRAGMSQQVAASFPARRAGQAADIAHAALFLMTNPYVTGTVLEVTGGETLVNSIG